MLKAVIIDDIQQARETLRADLETYCPDIEIIGEADGVVTGAKLLREQNPELVFLDIQMKDGSGFDLLEILGNAAFKTIFTTASDAYAIKAFRFSAVDYLLKPIDPDDLMNAVKKADIEKKDAKPSLDLLKDNLSGKGKKQSRIALSTQDKIHVVKISDIIRCESSVNYTTFYFDGGKKLLVTKTLKEFDDLLGEHNFIRVHQSHLVNAEFIKEFVKTDGGYLVMLDGSNVAVSSRKRATVMDWLEGL